MFCVVEIFYYSNYSFPICDCRILRLGRQEGGCQERMSGQVSLATYMMVMRAERNVVLWKNAAVVVEDSNKLDDAGEDEYS